MPGHLVLGCGSIGYSLVDRLGGWNGGLQVVDQSETRIESLRNDNIDAHLGDPTDPTTVDAITATFQTVIVAPDDPETAVGSAELAADRFPEAYLVVYTGESPSPTARERMAAVADRLIEYDEIICETISTALSSPAGDRLRRLKRALAGIDTSLAVFMHDNPDPDAIASAVALRNIAQARGLEADACYFGEISHQENRALVNLLDLDLVHFAPGEFTSEAYDGIALVDHARPGINNQLPPETAVDIVIDHHPPREPVEAVFQDLRSDVGATSTLLADYYETSGIAISQTVATALLYGIRVDTRDFGREITEPDFDAAAYLLPHVDTAVLDRVESPSVSGSTFETVARAIRNREQRGSVIASCVGEINDRDALAQAAEHLLAMEGVSTTFVYGYTEGTVFASARTRGTDLDIGEVLRDAFARIGSAGGHTEMAGAQLPLGIIGSVEGEAPDSLEEVVREVISNRFFDTLAAGITRPVGQYNQEPAEDAEEPSQPE